MAAVKAEQECQAAEAARLAGIARFIQTCRDKAANHPENAARYAVLIWEAETER